MYRFSFLKGRWSVAQLPSDEAIPDWASLSEDLISITRTRDELSIVCPTLFVPGDVKQETNWTVIKLQGPFPFSAVGVLAEVTTILAQAKISLFAISTYNTDYILVKADQAEAASAALTSAGHELIE